jgi:single-stranded DNA-binding protein
MLIGRLIRDPEVRQTRTEKEYVTCVFSGKVSNPVLTPAYRYTVATQNYPPPPPDANGGQFVNF